MNAGASSRSRRRFDWETRKIRTEWTPGAGLCATRGGVIMTTKAFAGALVGSLLMATALTPARAADMTDERALNPQREPQNWILHHGNYPGHRFSLLKEINTDT